MFVLMLNLMRGRAEESRYLARAETKEALERFVESERVTPYMDGEWSKCFRAGGPLEWFNGPDQTWGGNAYPEIVSREEAMDRAGRQWDFDIGNLPLV